MQIHGLMDRAWYGLALSLVQLGRLNEAAEALSVSTCSQPMRPYGWYRLVEVWQALEKPDEAGGVLEHLRQFEPGAAAQLERRKGLSR